MQNRWALCVHVLLYVHVQHVQHVHVSLSAATAPLAPVPQAVVLAQGPWFRVTFCETPLLQCLSQFMTDQMCAEGDGRSQSHSFTDGMRMAC